MFSLKRSAKKEKILASEEALPAKKKLVLTAAAKKAKKAEEKSQVSPIYAISYKKMGKYAKLLFPRLHNIEKKLQLAMMPIPYEAYVSAMLFLSLIGGIIGLAIGVVISLSLTFTSPELAILFPLIGGMAGFYSIFGMMFMYPKINVSTRRKALSEELPYFTGYMAMIAASGLTLEGVFRTVAREETKEQMVRDARYIMRNIEVLGMDIITAVQDLVRRSPSQPYTELLEGLIATVRSGGDMKSYFIATAKVQLEEKKFLQQKMTSSLGIVAEMYTTLLIVFPLLAVIILSIMAIMTPTLGGFNLTLLLNMVTYAFVPVVGIMMLLMMDAMVPKR